MEFKRVDEDSPLEFRELAYGDAFAALGHNGVHMRIIDDPELNRNSVDIGHIGAGVINPGTLRKFRPSDKVVLLGMKPVEVYQKREDVTDARD